MKLITAARVAASQSAADSGGDGAGADLHCDESEPPRLNALWLDRQILACKSETADVPQNRRFNASHRC